MKRKTINTILASLLLLQLPMITPSSPKKQPIQDLEDKTQTFFSETNTNININSLVKIDSAIYMSANPYEDPFTREKIIDAINEKYSCSHTTTKGLNDTSFFNTYGRSKANVLVLGGHHFAGTTHVFDNKINVSSFYLFPSNPNIDFILFRGCHTVMNPHFLDEEAKKPHFTQPTQEYFKSILNMAPNVKLIIGYETKSAKEKDYPLIVIAKKISLLEEEGLKSYGDYAIETGRKMYEIHGHEKDKNGNWLYDVPFYNNINKYREGTRIAYYLKTAETETEMTWTYYSQDHPEGIEIKLPLTPQYKPRTLSSSEQKNKEPTANTRRISRETRQTTRREQYLKSNRPFTRHNSQYYQNLYKTNLYP